MQQPVFAILLAVIIENKTILDNPTDYLYDVTATDRKKIFVQRSASTVMGNHSIKTYEEAKGIFDQLLSGEDFENDQGVTVDALSMMYSLEMFKRRLGASCDLAIVELTINKSEDGKEELSVELHDLRRLQMNFKVSSEAQANCCPRF